MVQDPTHTTQRSHYSHILDTIPETQDLNVDLEVVLPIVSVGVGHLPYDEIVNPNGNATTFPMHSMPEINSLVIGIQTAVTKYISPVFGWDRAHTRHFTLV